MTNIKLTLSALDTFFFRDGKPFSRGEQTEADGIFPPFPSTAYGALRTEYISENGGLQAFLSENFEEIKEIIGTKDSVQNASFRIKGIFLANEYHIYFPLPRDIVEEKEGEKLYLLSLLEPSDLFSNAPYSNLLRFEHKNLKVEYPPNAVINQNDIKDYLLDCRADYGCLKQDVFLKKEPKIGIGRNAKTLTSKEGLLYRLDMMRFTDKYHLCVEVSGISLPNQGILKLGGENKPFAYNVSETESCLDSDEFKKELAERLEQKRQNGKIRFKLYFATPTIGNQGRQIEKTGSSGIPCKLITAAIGKYMNVGGWDLAKKEPKTMYRAVPAGSVYYCETKSESTTAKDIVESFHYQNLSDQRGEEGFGLVLVGTV